MAGADRGERAAEQDGGESQVARLEIPQSGPELGFTPTVMEMPPAGRMGAWDTSVLRKASWCSAGGWQWVMSQGGPGWTDVPHSTAPSPRHPPLLPSRDIWGEGCLAEGKPRHGGGCLSPLHGWFSQGGDLAALGFLATAHPGKLAQGLVGPWGSSAA